jgi:hypothetical protein
MTNVPTYPRTVYVLTRNYSIRKVTLVEPQSKLWDAGGVTKGGLYFRRAEIFASHAAAIRAGRSQLKRRKKALEAGLALVAKQTEALDKSEKGTAA